MKNREWILLQFAKMDDDVLADAFCDTFENCYDKDGNCPLYNAVKDNCRMYPKTKEWMAKEHLYGTDATVIIDDALEV